MRQQATEQGGRHSTGPVTFWDEIDIWFTRNRFARVMSSAVGAAVLLLLVSVLGTILGD